ncbi:sulfate adenylyltransferase subunit 1 [Hydromonas duriensis]|uniref:sulfate adenylyltransferase n=1 Tax=Hydromonas duriensis TaxID=1527608 RepID=A0A4R6Y2G5_9BURK|nr:GTP-binding protein [Hydromonas duriensis]TDR30730.1 sulfate adenylyltransferase subunit 1 [Hydromonas duriensis]
MTTTHNQGLLRFITAGSVDDGKSTLIGRLLYDSKSIFVDQLSAVSKSKHNRSYDNSVDLSLLTDGLEAEREQGITIDVAYRYFATPRRKYIIADTPGHEQYTRNMVTGASTAHAAIILIDVGKIDFSVAGQVELLTQTKRHSALVALLGVKHVIVAANKMDLIDYDQSKYNRIVDSYTALAERVGLAHFTPIPLSALKGDNVVHASDELSWYTGSPLLELLDTLEVPDESAQALRFPVQQVVRHDGNKIDDFRGYAGRIESGTVRVGDTVVIQPQNRETTIAGIHTYDGERDDAYAGLSVTLTLADDIDISRGDWINIASQAAEVSKTRAADMCWFSDDTLSLSRKYLIKHGTRTVAARINAIDYKLDIHALEEHSSASDLKMNEIARVNVQLQHALPIDAYAEIKAGGAFIVIDEVSNQTLAAGMFA